MKIIKIIIERSKDAYWTYSKNVPMITGVGETVQEAKQSALDCIEMVKDLDNCPTILKSEFAIEYKYDVQSL